MGLILVVGVGVGVGGNSRYIVLISHSNFNGRRSCCTLCDSRFNSAQIIRQDKVSESSLLS